MVLTNTYIRGRRSGFSLVEYLVTLGLVVLIVGAGAAASENFLRAVAFLTNSMDLDAKNRLAIDRMSREIRGCDAVHAASSNELVLRVGTNLVAFEYHPDRRELIRTHPDTGAEVYLKGCDHIRFDLFRRNPLGGQYDIYPAATTVNCKIVQINWVCSRRLLGFQANTGRMESARVVIRNQQD
jgi:hypothetical protein